MTHPTALFCSISIYFVFPLWPAITSSPLGHLADVMYMHGE
jgi:hypothetical protein